MKNNLHIFMPLLSKGRQETRAARAIPILLELALEQCSITYKEMANRLLLNNPRHVVACLAPAAQVIERFYDYKAPDICVLVVSAATLLPGEGFVQSLNQDKIAFRKEYYSSLPLSAKRVIIENLRQEVFAFPHWRKLMKPAQNFVKYYI